MLLSSRHDRLKYCSVDQTKVLSFWAVNSSQEERPVLVFKRPETDRPVGIAHSEQMTRWMESKRCDLGTTWQEDILPCIVSRLPRYYLDYINYLGVIACSARCAGRKSQFKGPDRLLVFLQTIYELDSSRREPQVRTRSATTTPPATSFLSTLPIRNIHGHLPSYATNSRFRSRG